MRRKAADEVQIVMTMTPDEPRPVVLTARVDRYVESMRLIEAVGEARLMEDGAQAGRVLLQRMSGFHVCAHPAVDENGDRIASHACWCEIGRDHSAREADGEPS